MSPGFWRHACVLLFLRQASSVAAQGRSDVSWRRRSLCVCDGRAGKEELREKGPSTAHPLLSQPCSLPLRLLQALHVCSPWALTRPRAAAPCTHRFGKLPCTCLTHFTASASLNCLSFRGHNVPLCAGLPVGRGHGPAGGWASHVKWDGKTNCFQTLVSQRLR